MIENQLMYSKGEFKLVGRPYGWG